MRSARDGDRDAYDIPVTESIDAMYRVARLILRDYDSAADVGVTLPDGTQVASPAVLTGEGAYEGLSAVLLVDDAGCLFAYRCFVIEIPDLPVPFTGS